MSGPLLSRFDLVYVLLDRPDEARDRQLSEHLVALRSGAPHSSVRSTYRWVMVRLGSGLGLASSPVMHPRTNYTITPSISHTSGPTIRSKSEALSPVVIGDMGCGSNMPPPCMQQRGFWTAKHVSAQAEQHTPATLAVLPVQTGIRCKWHFSEGGPADLTLLCVLVCGPFAEIGFA